MDWKVKNVKAWNTVDGGGFTCSLYFGDKKVASVTDTGNGGPFGYHWDDKLYANMLNKHAASLPEVTTEWDDPNNKEKFSFQPGRDYVVGKLIDEFETKRKLRKLCRNKTMYRMPSDDENSWVIFDFPYGEGIRKHIRKTAGEDAIIANELFIKTK